jgi:hypothetical protein
MGHMHLNDHHTRERREPQCTVTAALRCDWPRNVVGYVCVVFWKSPETCSNKKVNKRGHFSAFLLCLLFRSLILSQLFTQFLLPVPTTLYIFLLFLALFAWCASLHFLYCSFEWKVNELFTCVLFWDYLLLSLAASTAAIRLLWIFFLLIGFEGDF